MGATNYLKEKYIDRNQFRTTYVLTQLNNSILENFEFYNFTRGFKILGTYVRRNAGQSFAPVLRNPIMNFLHCNDQDDRCSGENHEYLNQ